MSTTIKFTKAQATFLQKMLETATLKEAIDKFCEIAKQERISPEKIPYFLDRLMQMNEGK